MCLDNYYFIYSACFDGIAYVDDFQVFARSCISILRFIEHVLRAWVFSRACLCCGVCVCVCVCVLMCVCAVCECVCVCVCVCVCLC